MELAEVDLGRGILAAFTAAAGGNLAQHVGDDPGDVALARAALVGRVGAPVVFGRQVHGVTARCVDDAPLPDPSREDLGRHDGVDALVTTRTDRALGVLVADCVPVLLADPTARVVAVAHAGRVGLLDGVLGSVVDVMRQQGASPDGLRVVLGPSAGPCCYEVPPDMAGEAAARRPELAATTTWGTTSLDLRAGCRAALSEAGVLRVDTVGGCTIEDPTHFSHRRAGGRRTGRFAGVVRLLP